MSAPDEAGPRTSNDAAALAASWTTLAFAGAIEVVSASGVPAAAVNSSASVVPISPTSTSLTCRV
jgi:hypothetical protein